MKRLFLLILILNLGCVGLQVRCDEKYIERPDLRSALCTANDIVLAED